MMAVVFNANNFIMVSLCAHHVSRDSLIALVSSVALRYYAIVSFPRMLARIVTVISRSNCIASQLNI